jgi:hypothetical protein
MHDIPTSFSELTNKQLQDDFVQLGKEGHFIVKDEYLGRSLGVFTSGGDAQGIRLNKLLHLVSVFA